jgi:amino-acid N-acetyltransferase
MGLKIRKASMGEVEAMHELINRHAKRGRMLARSRLELYENLRDRFVAVEKGKVLGTAALHISWENLAEVKSVAVCQTVHGRGLGLKLVKACIDEARALNLHRIFVLTYVPDFFGKLGFKVIDRSDLPHRIWAECVRCPEFPDCGEIPMALRIGGRASSLASAKKTARRNVNLKGRNKRG